MKTLSKLIVIGIIWALWMQLPFLLYEKTIFLQWGIAASFNALNILIVFGVAALLWLETESVLRIGLLSAAGPFLIYALQWIEHNRVGAPVPFIKIAVLLHLTALLVLCLLVFVVKRFGERRLKAMGPVLMFCAFAFAFLGGESILRITSSSTWSEASDWRWFATHVHRDELGFRGRSLRRAPGKLRVLILGDSFTFGYKVDEDLIYPERLRRAFIQKGTDIQILNGSQINWSIPEEKAVYEKVRFIFRPQVVILAHVLNDIATDSNTPPLAAWRLWITYNLYVWNVIRPLFDHRGEASFIAETQRAYTPGTKGWSSYFNLLAELRDEVHQDGGQLGLVLFPWSAPSPYPFTQAHKDLSKSCQALGIPFLDLQPAFAPYSVRELSVTRTDLHPSAFAHKIAAEQVEILIGQLVRQKS